MGYVLKLDYMYLNAGSQLYGSTTVVMHGHLRFALKMAKFDLLPKTLG